MKVSSTESPSTEDLKQPIEKRKIDAEYALHDVMKFILRHLNAGDLCRVTQVCSSWHEAVRHEFTVRGPEVVSLKCYYRMSDLEKLELQKGYIGKTIRTKPHVMLSFGEFDSNLDRGHEYLMGYKDQLPRYWLLSAANHVVHNSRHVEDKDGLMNLSLPLSRGVSMKLVHCVCDLSVVTRESLRMALAVKELNDTVPTGKTALLVLGSFYYDTGLFIVQRIRENFRPNSFTIWGGLDTKFMKLVDRQVNDYPEYMGREGAVVVALAGCDSYTIVVSSHLTAKQFTHEFVSFRSRIQLNRLIKRGSCGLVYGSFDSKHKVKDLMIPLEKTFPEVEFIGAFYKESLVFGLDSTKDDNEQTAVHRNAISIMILSYN